MADFSHLSRLQVSAEKTCEYPIYDIDPLVGDKRPTLILKPATEENRPYYNALLRRFGVTRRGMQLGKITPEMIEENRDSDRKLFAEFVIVGWRNVYDSAGKAVSFSKQECEQFLNALPRHVFDGIRNFAADPQNFAEVIDAETTGKNSQTASSGN